MLHLQLLVLQTLLNVCQSSVVVDDFFSAEQRSRLVSQCLVLLSVLPPGGKTNKLRRLLDAITSSVFYFLSHLAADLNNRSIVQVVSNFSRCFWFIFWFIICSFIYLFIILANVFWYFNYWVLIEYVLFIYISDYLVSKFFYLVVSNGFYKNSILVNVIREHSIQSKFWFLWII